MVGTGARAVLDRMEADEAFGERIRGAGSPEAALALLRAEGFEATADEMRDAALDRYGNELDEEQLDALAAGADVDAITLGLTAGAVVAMGAAWSAAAAAI
jgi:predicted ribosomally synthesized peptide with nif11-like leader